MELGMDTIELKKCILFLLTSGLETLLLRTGISKETTRSAVLWKF